LSGTFAERYGVQSILITTEQALRELCDRVRLARLCAVDTETSSYHPVGATLVGISLCYEVGSMYYIPCAHAGERAEGEQLPVQVIARHLAPLFSDATIRFVMHHAQFDLLILAAAGLPVAACSFDTMVAAHLCVQTGERIGLKALSSAYLQQEMQSYDELMKQGPYASMQDVPLAQAADYAGADAHQTLQLLAIFERMLDETNQRSLYEHIELPLVPVLAAMEREGILLDTAVLRGIGVRVDHELRIVEQQIRDFVGEEGAAINLNAPRQIERLLFEILKLEPVKKTASGGYSTDQSVLSG